MQLLASVILAILAYKAVTSFPQMIIGRIFGRFLGPLAGMFLGAMATWLILDIIWQEVFGNHITISALILGIIAIILAGKAGETELNANAKMVMSAEVWGIIGITIYVIFAPGPVAWF
mgnify:CR=1 FL=1